MPFASPPSAIGMSGDLSCIPLCYQQELAEVVRVLRHEFAARAPGATEGIVQIVLFGSFAAQRWVDDHISGYKSDFDILVVVGDAHFAEMLDYWETAEERLLSHREIRREVQLIIHPLDEINQQLQRGHYFFKEIIEQGIVLYHSGRQQLATPCLLAAQETYHQAEQYAAHWLSAAESMLAGSQFMLSRHSWRECAFSLHQTVERAYRAVLLTHTLYAPPSHNIKHLRKLAEGLDPRLSEAWPRWCRQNRRCFEQLKRAYVEARYSFRFAASEADLQWTMAAATRLISLAKSSCEGHLQRLSRDRPGGGSKGN